jgi:DNA-binding CsgD family transcriptional regulator
MPHLKHLDGSIHACHFQFYANTYIITGQIMNIEYKTEHNPTCKINFFWELARAKDFHEFSQRIKSIINRMGFTDYAFMRLNTTGTQLGILFTHHKIADLYESKEFNDDSIILKHGHVSTAPIFLSTIQYYTNNSPFETEIFKRSHDLYRICKCYGFYDAYNIPVKAFNGNGNVMLILCARKMESPDFRRQVGKYKQDLNQLAQAIDYVGTRKFPESFLNSKENSQIMVTPKPLQLLNTLAKDNITLKNAASQLSISLDTANKHIANIKHALGANTQAAAVYRAVKEGLIEPDV